MLPKTHIITGFIASLILWAFIPQVTIFYALIIFLASFLIDFDHYLFYVFKQKDYNLKRAFWWFIEKGKFYNKLSLEKREEYRRVIMIFHGIECWIILLLAITLHEIFLFILVGIAIHMTLDFIDIYRQGEPFYQKISQVLVHVRNNKKTKTVFDGRPWEVTS